jgi:hypothetical protein
LVAAASVQSPWHQVFDVWESQEAFEAFGTTLLPIMAELGADPGQPMVARVHNVIAG